MRDEGGGKETIGRQKNSNKHHAEGTGKNQGVTDETRARTLPQETEKRGNPKGVVRKEARTESLRNITQEGDHIHQNFKYTDTRKKCGPKKKFSKNSSWGGAKKKKV